MKKKVSTFIVFLVCFASLLVLAADKNLIALHNSSSSQYDSNCLTSGCHATLLEDEKSLNPAIPGAHEMMIVYVPGYNPRKGITNNNCIHCHRSVDLIKKSAANLRKNVSPQSCALCHTNAGPGKPLYK